MINLLKTSFFKEVEHFIIVDNLGKPIQVPVRYSNKAKHISIRINHNGPELVLPNKNFEAGKRFLLKKEDWIRKKLRNLEKHIPEDSNSIYVLGKKYSIEYIESTKSKIHIEDDLIQIYAKPLKQRDNLIKFLKELLLDEIIEVTSFLSKKHNLQFSKIKLTNNKTKWGSCNSKGVLSFNWRLIFATKEVLDYLIVHEMSHLTHMNHSKKFWNLVEEIYPDYKIAKLWLKQNGKKLHLYLA
jgi:predicted metal-dependent hydrolase